MLFLLQVFLGARVVVSYYGGRAFMCIFKINTHLNWFGLYTDISANASKIIFFFAFLKGDLFHLIYTLYVLFG